ncbi:acyl-CoA dehydrogenase family protein [Dyadobacter fanqingshengii]|uniref:Cyclohexane-1-carbonyl-CoA dehydrogenase n=1 Tax=Dyadobacter fanqingshengii TaxID=2906443 RepID=A0A9X1PFX7_9BACT|nr:acyl-CoA dehydrogenase family protein [Dyadobacter fanqingshengii]MCF0043095.1 acyl-CoA dehydrogenase family protein [Dyadobacter fanqingshengii]USJ35648.1 acyl-CoA dehydrogenase family protein [Dyadobacter fanqingshengii]
MDLIKEDSVESQREQTCDLIRETVKDFAAIHIKPYIREWDEAQQFPKTLFHSLGEMGLMGMLVPEEYGGSGLGYKEYVTAIIELSKTDPSVGLSMAAHNSLCTNHILMFGNEEQKQTYLPKLASGQHVGAWGLTEPNTGSDAGNMQTVAVREGSDWIINGSKNFITNGKSGDVAVIITRTGEPGDKHGATAFIIEQGTPGFSSGRKEDKLGMRASETVELIFQDCRVSDSQRLGDIGDGFVQSLKVLDGGRISIAALGVGTALGAYEAALAYSKERKQFGKAICDFQAIAFKLADMYTDVQASTLLTFHAAALKDAGQKVTLPSAVAKYHSSETAVRVANEAVQIFGGYGFVKDYPAEKFYRDSKLCTIGEGTSEIQKMVISKEILKN